MLRNPGPGRPLLKELQLTPRQRFQIQELIRQQRLQQLFYDQRLQQILTPAQRQKLLRYNRQKEITDSLNNQKKLP
jgi:Spy/CpxP family protein refolding chaperone